MPVQTRSMSKKAQMEDNIIRKLHELINYQASSVNREERISRMVPFLDFLLKEDCTDIVQKYLYNPLREKIHEIFEKGVPTNLAILMTRVYEKYYM